MFSEKTICALKNHPKLKNIDGVNETIEFLEIVTSFWNILNVRVSGLGNRLSDENRSEFLSIKDPRLDKIQQCGEMCLKMKAQSNKKLENTNYQRILLKMSI